MRISDWSSDVCSSDLTPAARSTFPMRPLSAPPTPTEQTQPETSGGRPHAPKRGAARSLSPRHPKGDLHAQGAIAESGDHCRTAKLLRVWLSDGRSEEHTSELQSLMRNSYAVFCLKKKKNTH